MIAQSLMSLMSLTGGYVGGFLKLLVRNSHDFKMALTKADVADRKRSQQSTNKGFNFTRRVIAISLTWGILSLGFMGAIIGQVIVYKTHPGWLARPFKGDTVHVVHVYGVYIFDSMWDAFLAVIGCYFGERRKD